MALAELILMVGQAYSFILLARVLMSWVQVDPYNPLVQLLYQVTEPVLAPIRQLMPTGAGLDFSPIIAMLAVQILTQVFATMVA